MGSQEELALEMECAICYSQYNNAFRALKVLQCQHTFCLECLARINVKSQLPDTIQCPMCWSYTRLPDSGPPKLDNNLAILSCLPKGMNRTCSIHFSHSKGRLWLKQLPEGSSTFPHLLLSQVSDASVNNTRLPTPVPLPWKSAAAAQEEGTVPKTGREPLPGAASQRRFAHGHAVSRMLSSGVAIRNLFVKVNSGPARR
uniref:RING-type domain-containing protein n=1 Tax=Crocodylus porosus TaxID=8502 RepID=A0A7M4F239_CROPO